MPYFCYECGHPRSLCTPGSEPGSCARAEASAAEYQAEKKAGTLRAFIGGWMVGGSRQVDREMTFTRNFDRGLHRYREARRSGEHPDSTTVEGVEKAQKRVESHARGRKKLEAAGIEVA